MSYKRYCLLLMNEIIKNIDILNYFRVTTAPAIGHISVISTT